MSAPEERVRLDRSAPTSSDISRTELLDLYRIVVDEYRFQVRLNWDRTQHSFVLNTALTTLGFTVMGTLKQGGSWIALWVFAIAAVAAWLGRTVVKTGHSYYRRVVYRKTMIEDLLGRLAPLPAYHSEHATLHLATTGGMADAKSILESPETYLQKSERPGSIVMAMLHIHLGFLFVNALGGLIAAIRSFA